MKGLRYFNATADTLEPAPFPIGVLSEYCAPHPTSFQFKTDPFSWSSNDCAVHDLQGNLCWRVDAKTFSMRRKKDIYDAYNRPLFRLQKKLGSMLSCFEAYAPDSDSLRLFRLKRRFAWPKFKMTLSFNNHAYDGQEMELDLECNMWERCATISWQGRTLAVMTRDIYNRDRLFLHAETWFVHIAPGVDSSLIMAATICLIQIIMDLDRQREDERRKQMFA